MNEDSGNLAVRALNHWHAIYLPTYVALRLFLQQVPQSQQSDYLEAFLKQKGPLGELCRYRPFLRFKGFNSKKEIEYRQFHAASPSASLGEAYVLRLLLKVKELANRPCVFSYQWPRNTKEGRSYRYFFSGYDARQRQVSSLLRVNPDYVVLVHDIQSFYGSISKDEVYKRLEGYLNKDSDTSREIASTVCRQVLDATDKGVPVGPALGHIFGNIALEAVDSQMYKKFKERYLRYVDDIFIVVDPRKVSVAQAELENLIGAERFSLHTEQGKRDEVSSQEWLDNIRTAAEETLGQEFDTYFSRMRLFLWHRPKELSVLQKQFRAEGIPMPLRRLAIDARYGRFQRFMRQYVRSSRGKLPGFLYQFLTDDRRKLLAGAIQLRDRFLESAKRIDILELRNHGMVRRLRVQRLRYLLNRLLYLMPIHDFQTLLDLTPDIDEFFEYRSMVQAVISGRLDPILRLPGPAIAAFGSLFRELGFEDLPKYDVNILNSKGVIDSVCGLALLGSISVPDSWVSNLPDADSELVRFSQFSALDTRLTGSQSFEDEIRTLQLGESPEAVQNILDSRFNDMESVNLEALLFSDYGS